MEVVLITDFTQKSNIYLLCVVVGRAVVFSVVVDFVVDVCTCRGVALSLVICFESICFIVKPYSKCLL